MPVLVPHKIEIAFEQRGTGFVFKLDFHRTFGAKFCLFFVVREFFLTCARFAVHEEAAECRGQCEDRNDAADRLFVLLDEKPNAVESRGDCEEPCFTEASATRVGAWVEME